MYSCTAIWSPASKVQSSGSAYLYSAVARAISGFAGGAEGARFGREGAAGVLYAGGGGSLRRMLLKALVGTPLPMAFFLEELIPLNLLE